MRIASTSVYVSPQSHQYLSVKVKEQVGEEIVNGNLSSLSDGEFAINQGIPDFTYPRNLAPLDARARDFYEERIDSYENNLHLTFRILGDDEITVRTTMIDALQLEPSCKVLEIACGTGRDTVLIAGRLGSSGQLFCQDISPGMVRFCREKLNAVGASVECSVANACYLPFPNHYFDAVYSFGALGEFSDIRRSLVEMVRVTKVGGRIGVGDESMPPWLRATTFSKILTTTNPQYSAEVPLGVMPVEARDVRLRWFIGGVFYYIDFVVGEGEPKANFDLEIPGARGGTLRTRYEGQLEGVTPEAKALAQQVVTKKGVSMHAWLDTVVREAAQKDLSE